MKRKCKVPEWVRVREILPKFFWHTCQQCGAEYKKEPMWEGKVRTQSTFYLCKNCAPDLKTAKILFSAYRSDNTISRNAAEGSFALIRSILRGAAIDEEPCLGNNREKNETS